MDKQFNPKAIESKWYERWEKHGDFAPAGDGEPYCIMLPPPNVTGSLHMGHAFQHTLMDALTRYHRMRGRRTLWQPGTDHAGIATQMVVERQLAAENSDRHTLGREAFVERIRQWKTESGDTITRQMRRLGASVDWSRECFTMDPGPSAAVNEVFVRLYQEGLIYRGQRLVNWDPVLRTAISDLEVISEEEDGHLWHFRYPLADGSGHVSVATTRPETMLGDTAVAVNPEDERYRHLVGKSVRLPLAEREIPIIADDYVDPEFGSGCVKITPAHDFNDYAVGERHNLPKINIFNADGTVKSSEFDDFSWGHRAPSEDNIVSADTDPAGLSTIDSIPEQYRGLDRFKVRDMVVADMDAAGLLEKVEKHRLMVPRGDRSGAVIEPYLTDQWFVRAEPLAGPAIHAVESGRIRFVPGNWDKTYFEWMRNIQDWCISRQLWWGHQIPAWYDEDGNIYVGRDEAEARERHGLGDRSLKRDEDVLDTWFSSALWPFSTLGWPEDTEALRAFYPTSVLVTGFDIIFFWVARMIMTGLKFMDDVPFHEVYITGLIRDSEGQKMSKSKGNVLDPLDLIDGIDLESLVAKRTAGLMQPRRANAIEKVTRHEYPEGIPAYGTDALRFTFAALASQGRDIRFDLERVAGYRNFCNKLWNAARFVVMNTEGRDCGAGEDAEIELSWGDRWIVSRLQRVEADVERHIHDYRFDLAARALYDFVWHHYCDWYLELCKPALNAGAGDARERGTRHTLVRVLEATLRLLHPFTPFITEEIWQRVAPLAGVGGDSIQHRPYPRADEDRIDPEAEAEIDWLREVILGLRQIRGEMDIAPRKPLPVLVQNADAEDRARLERHRPALDFLAAVASIRVLDGGDESPEAATALAGRMTLLVPMAGLIDKEAELARLDKRLTQLDRERNAVRGKLDNENFVNKAPEDVVRKQRERLTELESAIEELHTQRGRVAGI